MDDEQLLEPGEDGRFAPADGVPAAAPATSVVVRVGGERLAVLAEALDEVALVPVLTRVPGAPAFVRGVVNHRGRVLAVLDLRTLLGLPGSTSAGRAARLLVCGSDGVDLGLLVDAVEGMSAAGSAALEPPLATLPAAVAALVAGTALDEQGPVTLLSIRALAALRDQVPSGPLGSPAPV